MKPYRNIQGNSGVVAYKIEPQAITVTFTGGDSYKYTYKSAGKGNIEKMKKLAEAGKGLSTFISQHVKDKYESKVL